MRRARTLKYTVIAAFVVAAGLGLIAATQDWFGFHLVSTAERTATVEVQGSDVAPGLTTLSLAGIALAGALAMAGRFARLMLGVLGVVLGVCILWSSASPLGDPIAVGSATISKQTGVAGDTAVHHLVARTDVAAWPAVGIVAGALFILASLAVILTFTAWPSASRRYDAVRFADASAGDAVGAQTHDTETTEPTASDQEPAADPDQQGAVARDAAIDSWDELSRGQDPTEHQHPTQHNTPQHDPTQHGDSGPDAPGSR